MTRWKIVYDIHPKIPGSREMGIKGFNKHINAVRFKAKVSKKGGWADFL